MMQCLTEIIGVTQSDCQCIINGLSSDEIAKLRTSKSGLYMDDLPGGVHLKALTRMDACKNMAQMALTARDNAIKTLENDLIIALNNRYKKDKNTFAGQIGRMSYAQSLGVVKPWQGMRIRPNDWSDGMITMTRLHIILNQSVTLTVKLYRVFLDSVMGEEIAAWPVTTTANAYTVVPIGANPIKMPLVYNGEMVEYYLLFDTSEPGTPVQPKDTAVQCSSCNGGIAPFSDYVTVYGVQVDDPSNLTDKLTDAFSHGLILDVEIKCDNERIFCREYVEDEAVAVAMAYATWYKSGELLIEDVLKQPDVNRYTTMAREYLWGKRNHFRSEYESRVNYLGAVIDVQASNCYVCRTQTNQPFYSPIFS